MDENGNVVRKDRFENSYEKLKEYIFPIKIGGSFVMEYTGFYEPLHDFIKPLGFNVKLVNSLQIIFFSCPFFIFRYVSFTTTGTLPNVDICVSACFNTV